MSINRPNQAQNLQNESNDIFSEWIKRKYTFYDANVADNWG